MGRCCRNPSLIFNKYKYESSTNMEEILSQLISNYNFTFILSINIIS